MNEQRVEHRVGHRHSHMAWVGVAGTIAGAILMVYVPSLKVISSVLLLFAGFHVVGLMVLLASAYVMGGNRLVERFRRGARASERIDFGWAPAWTYGPWIAALALAAAAVALEVAAPAIGLLRLRRRVLPRAFLPVDLHLAAQANMSAPFCQWWTC